MMIKQYWVVNQDAYPDGTALVLAGPYTFEGDAVQALGQQVNLACQIVATSTLAVPVDLAWAHPNEAADD